MKISKDNLLKKVSSKDNQLIKSLDILIEDINANTSINFFGRLAFWHQLINRMKVRDRIETIYKKNNFSNVADPIFITGLPRSGTTFLFDLLNINVDLRGPLYWEITRPTPVINSRSKKAYIRSFFTDVELNLARLIVPNLDAMHKIRANSPEECEQLNTITAKSVVYLYMAKLPNYFQYLMQTDFTNVFEWHKKFFQILELSNRPKKWLLKDPSHIEHIPEILKVYPNAKFIHLFRDPLKSIASTCSLTSKIQKGLSKSINNKGIGKDIITFWGNAIAKNKIGRALLRADQNLDIEYSEFIADPIETIKNIYDFLKLPLNSDELERKQNFLKVHVKNKYGKHSYQLEDYGLTDNLVNEKISLNWQIQ